MTVEKAEKLVSNIDFYKYIEIVKNQSLDVFPNLKREELDIKEIYTEKKRWRKHYENQLSEMINNSPDKHHEIERELNSIARFILRSEQSILNIKNRGWFINFNLLGKIWASAESLRTYRDQLLKMQLPSSSQQGLDIASRIPIIEIKELGKVIYPDYVNQFADIEKELHQRPIDKPFLIDFEWQYTKTALCQFLVTIIELGWAKRGKNSEVNSRRFFEQRYGYKENELAGMFKPSKRPIFGTARIPFHFINIPVKG